MDSRETDVIQRMKMADLFGGGEMISLNSDVPSFTKSQSLWTGRKKTLAGRCKEYLRRNFFQFRKKEYAGLKAEEPKIIDILGRQWKRAKKLITVPQVTRDGKTTSSRNLKKDLEKLRRMHADIESIGPGVRGRKAFSSRTFFQSYPGKNAINTPLRKNVSRIFRKPSNKALETHQYGRTPFSYYRSSNGLTFGSDGNFLKNLKLESTLRDHPKRELDSCWSHLCVKENKKSVHEANLMKYAKNVHVNFAYEVNFPSYRVTKGLCLQPTNGANENEDLALPDNLNPEVEPSNDEMSVYNAENTWPAQDKDSTKAKSNLDPKERRFDKKFGNKNMAVKMSSASSKIQIELEIKPDSQAEKKRQAKESFSCGDIVDKARNAQRENASGAPLQKIKINFEFGYRGKHNTASLKSYRTKAVYKSGLREDEIKQDFENKTYSGEESRQKNCEIDWENSVMDNFRTLGRSSTKVSLRTLSSNETLNPAAVPSEVFPLRKAEKRTLILHRVDSSGSKSPRGKNTGSHETLFYVPNNKPESLNRVFEIKHNLPKPLMVVQPVSKYMLINTILLKRKKGIAREGKVVPCETLDSLLKFYLSSNPVDKTPPKSPSLQSLFYSEDRGPKGDMRRKDQDMYEPSRDVDPSITYETGPSSGQKCQSDELISRSESSVATHLGKNSAFGAPTTYTNLPANSLGRVQRDLSSSKQSLQLNEELLRHFAMKSKAKFRRTNDRNMKSLYCSPDRFTEDLACQNMEKGFYPENDDDIPSLEDCVRKLKRSESSFSRIKIDDSNVRQVLSGRPQGNASYRKGNRIFLQEADRCNGEWNTAVGIKLDDPGTDLVLVQIPHQLCVVYTVNQVGPNGNMRFCSSEYEFGLSNASLRKDGMNQPEGASKCTVKSNPDFGLGETSVLEGKEVIRSEPFLNKTLIPPTPVFSTSVDRLKQEPLLLSYAQSIVNTTPCNSEKILSNWVKPASKINFVRSEKGLDINCLLCPGSTKTDNLVESESEIIRSSSVLAPCASPKSESSGSKSRRLGGSRESANGLEVRSSFVKIEIFPDDTPKTEENTPKQSTKSIDGIIDTSLKCGRPKCECCKSALFARKRDRRGERRFKVHETASKTSEESRNPADKLRTNSGKSKPSKENFGKSVVDLYKSHHNEGPTLSVQPSFSLLDAKLRRAKNNPAKEKSVKNGKTKCEFKNTGIPGLETDKSGENPFEKSKSPKPLSLFTGMTGKTSIMTTKMYLFAPTDKADNRGITKGPILNEVNKENPGSATESTNRILSVCARNGNCILNGKDCYCRATKESLMHLTLDQNNRVKNCEQGSVLNKNFNRSTDDNQATCSYASNADLPDIEKESTKKADEKGPIVVENTKLTQIPSRPGKVECYLSQTGGIKIKLNLPVKESPEELRPIGDSTKAQDANKKLLEVPITNNDIVINVELDPTSLTKLGGVETEQAMSCRQDYAEVMKYLTSGEESFVEEVVETLPTICLSNKETQTAFKISISQGNLVKCNPSLENLPPSPKGSQKNIVIHPYYFQKVRGVDAKPRVEEGEKKVVASKCRPLSSSWFRLVQPFCCQPQLGRVLDEDEGRSVEKVSGKTCSTSTYGVCCDCCPCNQNFIRPEDKDCTLCPQCKPSYK